MTHREKRHKKLSYFMSLSLSRVLILAVLRVVLLPLRCRRLWLLLLLFTPRFVDFRHPACFSLVLPRKRTLVVLLAVTDEVSFHENRGKNHLAKKTAGGEKSLPSVRQVCMGCFFSKAMFSFLHESNGADSNPTDSI